MKNELSNEMSSGIMVYRIGLDGKREYLFLVRKEGFLDFPKGHIEEGETEMDAARRETLEETGMNVNIIPGFRHEMEYLFSHRDQKVKKTVVMFAGRAMDDESPTISHEHVGFVWMKYEDALKSLTYENQRKMLEEVDRFLDTLGNP
ncbi:MAG: NUDIX domain-containing protein [Candidatus Thermoplasmatota archaeon]|jgi:bis(5'-nucleosidyl)-tetraphosphatase|nr:NUDIX domain-containing protein [Candidatus Thermoplasmatota archaeon]